MASSVCTFLSPLSPALVFPWQQKQQLLPLLFTIISLTPLMARVVFPSALGGNDRKFLKSGLFQLINIDRLWPPPRSLCLGLS